MNTPRDATSLAVTLRQRALACLARREYCRAELAQHLRLSLQRDARRQARADQAERRGADLREDESAATFPNLAQDLDLAACACDADPADLIDTLLTELASRGLLDDGRAAESLIHRRGQGLGRSRLALELRRKGVPEEVVATALDEAGMDAANDEARARSLHERRYGEVPPADLREAQRRMRFLLARGFSTEVVKRVVPRPVRPD